jgi:hypothetical protein
MLLIVAIVLLAFWLLGLVMFKITKGIIHLVLLIAVVALVMHFMHTPA